MDLKAHLLFVAVYCVVLSQHLYAEFPESKQDKELLAHVETEWKRINDDVLPGLRLSLTKATKGRVNALAPQGVVRDELRRGDFRYIFRTKEDQQEEIKRLQKLIELYQRPGQYLIPNLGFRSKMTVGSIGKLAQEGHDTRFMIRQVIDEKNALLEWIIVYIPEGLNAYYDKTRQHEMMLWYKGSTSGWIDGVGIELENKVFRVVGTNQYETANGSNTVMVIESYETVPLFRELLKSYKMSMREWSDISGKFKIEGSLVGESDGAAKIKKDSGEIISVPFEKLSDKDQLFLETVRD